MNAETKISSAFEPFLAESGPNDIRDAIVIYRAPTGEGPRPRGRLRALKQRLDYVKARAAAQEPIQAALFEGYRKAGGKRLRAKQQLAVSAIGTTALPLATVEVTRKRYLRLAAPF